MNKPLLDRVIVKKITETKTKGGIILTSPESTEYFYRGEVISVGERVTLVKQGDIVAIGRNSGTDFQEEDLAVWYRIVKEIDILFIIEE